MPTCPWCGEPTDQTAADTACMIAHCSSCRSDCRPCQRDMASEGVA